MNKLYLIVIGLLVMDLVTAIAGIVQALQGKDTVLVTLICISNLLMFGIILMDDGEDLYQEEVNKRLVKVQKDYGLD
jgi:hypothetical protein